MIKMFAQGFAAFTVFFAAFENLAKALLHFSSWAEEGAGAMADQARLERQAKVEALMAQRKQAQATTIEANPLPQIQQ